MLISLTKVKSIIIHQIMIQFSKEEFDQLKKGDVKQITRFYYSYKDDVYNYLLIKTRGNKDLAADLSSEVNSEVLASIGKIKNDSNLSGWVLRIAYYQYCDYIKKVIKDKKKIERQKNELLVNPRDEFEVDDTDNKNFLISTALKNLKEEYRIILNLKYYENKSIKELALIYNVTESALGSMLFRAKEALKNEIKMLSSYLE
jgi:RNA polymerase sigma-70 factor (ECF subfamily)